MQPRARHQAAICGGIGQGAADALAATGIEPLVLVMWLSIEEAAAGYLAGNAGHEDRARVAVRVEHVWPAVDKT